MKLVDILAMDLEEWPEGVCGNDGITQDSNGALNTIDDGEFHDAECNSEGIWRDEYCSLVDGPKGSICLEVAEDQDTAKVTRKEWEAARHSAIRKDADTTLSFNRYEPSLFDGAPEGTTHYSLYKQHYSKWHKLEDGMWYYWCTIRFDWEKYTDQDNAKRKLANAIERPVVESVMEEKQEDFLGKYFEDNPVMIRERILVIRSEREAGVQEEKELIKKLQDMGFALIDVAVPVDSTDEEPELDMTDPANWKEGDILTCVESNGRLFDGKDYKVLKIRHDHSDVWFVGVKNMHGSYEEFFAWRFEFKQKGERN